MKQLLFLLICMVSLSVSAQNSLDIIVLKSGEEVECKVLEVGISEVKYKLQTEQESPIYIISKSEIFMIKYTDGRKDIFNQEKSELQRDNRGYTGITTMGVLIRGDSNPFSFEIINGTSINEHFMLGFGAGFEMWRDLITYGNLIMIPVFIAPQFAFLDGTVSPLLTTNIGFQMSTQDFEELSTLFINPEVGIRVYFASNAAFTFKIGYKRLFYEDDGIDLTSIKGGFQF